MFLKKKFSLFKIKEVFYYGKNHSVSFELVYYYGFLIKLILRLGKSHAWQPTARLGQSGGRPIASLRKKPSPWPLGQPALP